MITLIGSEYPTKMIDLFNAAKKSIDIVVYDWRWYEDHIGHPVQQFNMSLVRAAQRGVRVRAVINSKDLIEKLNSLKIKARQLGDKRTLHSKLVMIDDNLLIIGSHNFTRNAFTSNIETSIIVDMSEDSTRLKDFFNNIYGF